MAVPAVESAEEPATEAGGEDAAEPASEPSGGAVSLGDEDIVTILQRIIDDEEVNQYLRLGEPGRLPLKVKGDVVPGGAELVKGAPAEIVDEVEEGAAVLEFTSLETTQDKVTVRFRFDVEGVKGAVTLQQGLRGWEILRSRITQR